MTMVVDVCIPRGPNYSEKITCNDDGDDGYYRTWALNADCEGNHGYEIALSDAQMEVVCDADPCHVAVFENYVDETGSCDYDSTPALAVYIIDECLVVGASQSMVITCTGTQDAMISYYDNDEEHECSGTATMTATADEILGGDCGSIVACDVVAEVDADDSNASEDSSESSGLSAVSDCNHAVFDDDVLIADFCVTDDSGSRMLLCLGGVGYLRSWGPGSDGCEPNWWKAEEEISTNDGTVVVCDADPCQIAVLEVYDDYNSCDLKSQPQIQPIILDTCFPVDDTESLFFSCTGTHDAKVQHFMNDPDHECGESAVTTTTLGELYDQGEYCAEMIACNVNAGDDYGSSESSGLPAVRNCNHAVLDEGVLIADSCVTDGRYGSRMLRCRDGYGFLRSWGSDNCEPGHISGDGFMSGWEEHISSNDGIAHSVVCDADPCQIAVLEVYDDGSFSSSCDLMILMTESEPEIQSLFLDTCVPVDDTESMIFSCESTHYAMVQHFLNDPDHECSGSAVTMSTLSELQGDYCAETITCNVTNGAYAAYSSVFTSLLIAVALLRNA